MTAVDAGEQAAAVDFEFTEVPASRPQASLAEDVREGLTRRPRELHPKYFYDERGSALFDAICDTPEYYLTRTEDRLLRRHAAEVMALTQPHSMLELGSGTSRKTRHLLDHWEDEGRIYWPFDVSADMLRAVGRRLVAEYGHLEIHPLIGDYTAGFGNLPDLEGRTLALFLGSTLGNFAPAFAERFLADFVSHLDPGDWFLLGADLDKDPALIEAAYNDTQGITAAFNRNVLAVINRELDADFDTDAFAHRAVYNRQLRRVEMYLTSVRAQRVRIDALGLDLRFQSDESILTEISRKFTRPEIYAMLERSGLRVEKSFVAEDFPYALVLARR